MLDPERIVTCLRGATLESVTAVRKCAGRVTVKVRPLSVQYRGTIEYAAIDHGALHVSVAGKGRGQGAAGSAEMTMES